MFLAAMRATLVWRGWEKSHFLKMSSASRSMSSSSSFVSLTRPRVFVIAAFDRRMASATSAASLRASRAATASALAFLIISILDSRLAASSLKFSYALVSRRLMRKGYEVVLALDGEEGMAKAESEAPDLILMDMSLPLVDGWEATRQIKASEELNAIPIIALTAHAMPTDRDKALEAGCDDYDTKPVELPRLLEKIERLL